MISLCIAAGEAVGSLARHCIAAVLELGPAFPWGTRLVNGARSPVIGAAAGGTIGDARLLATPFVRQFAIVERCGCATRLVVTRVGCALAAARARWASRRRVSWT